MLERAVQVQPPKERQRKPDCQPDSCECPWSPRRCIARLPDTGPQQRAGEHQGRTGEGKPEESKRDVNRRDSQVPGENERFVAVIVQRGRQRGCEGLGDTRARQPGKRCEKKPVFVAGSAADESPDGDEDASGNPGEEGQAGIVGDRSRLHQERTLERILLGRQRRIPDEPSRVRDRRRDRVPWNRQRGARGVGGLPQHALRVRADGRRREIPDGFLPRCRLASGHRFVECHQTGSMQKPVRGGNLLRCDTDHPGILHDCQ